MNIICIVDFGGQYCHLIARRLRDFGVETSIIAANDSYTLLQNQRGVRGIILSGGARSVYEKDAPLIDKRLFKLHIPVLGICYGHQLMAQMLGGTVLSGDIGEYGITALTVLQSKSVLTGISKQGNVWMNHRDVVTQLPSGFEILAKTNHTKIAGYSCFSKKWYGVQFHPEVTHTEQGTTVLKNFVINICGCEKSLTVTSLCKTILEETKKMIGNEKAIIGLSGGVDSSVAAALVSQAIGKQLTAVYVDTGLMRFQETDFIKKAFVHQNLNLQIIDASKMFFKALRGVVDPEQKRKIIGKTFIDVFNQEAKKVKATYLIQGTIYSDRIESGITQNSSVIKSHHNVGGLPKNMKLTVYEPLRDLYKDEVRNLARILKLPEEVATRHVFPGPGLAIRMLGEVTPEKTEIVRQASRIVEEELMKTRYWKKIWMCFAVLLPIKSVGIQGDERSYKFPVVIRIMESKDAMTANFSRIPYPILEKISTRITNEIKEVNRVVYDITNKPPGTMEWE
ncbi:MAG: glutamine-hydrolyzing GMP synthase [Candidatus Gottesmanbacteria bacterium]